jgi:hypothetical protein
MYVYSTGKVIFCGTFCTSISDYIAALQFKIPQLERGKQEKIPKMQVHLKT